MKGEQKMAIQAFYFSPTHTTEQITLHISDKMAEILSLKVEKNSLTKPAERAKDYALTNSDILVLGLPVYGGRIPLLLEQTLKGMKGENTPAVLVTVYGNRDFDDALLEMKDLLSANGFKVVAAGAFIGEHSFSKKLAADRPDGQDMEIATDFAQRCAKKLIEKDFGKLIVKGHHPYKERNPNAPVAPKTKDSCNRCMICYNACPTQAISSEDPKIADQDKCIKCCACVKSCPLGAKYFDAEMMLKSTAWLETNFMDRKEPEFFL